jgi:hypothetical protein
LEAWSCVHSSPEPGFFTQVMFDTKEEMDPDVL